MFPVSSLFAKCFSRLAGCRSGRRPPSPRQKKAFRPGIEALEERQVPTVLFKPLFGAEGSSHPGARVCLTNFNVCSSLQSPNIYPIFWGNYWLQNPEADQLAAAFTKIVQSGYLSGTTQYLTDGAANVMPPFIDLANDVPGKIGPGYNNPASLEIEHVLYDENSLPKPDEAPNGTEPIYVVITGPGVAGDGVNGFNQPGFHTVPDADVREEIWLGTRLTPGGQLDLDYTTRTFSHELVEAATDPLGPVGLLSPLGINGPSGETVSPGSGFTGNTSAGGLGNQIADNEPNNNYVYRLGGPTGVLAQAYWSDTFQQYAVPDGNSFVAQINPDLWSGSPPGFKSGTLVLDTNQPGFSGGGNVITLDTYTNPAGLQGVQVTVDGQNFAFEPGQISGIQVKAANDTDTIAVNGTLTGVPVSISLGTGTYLVKLDPLQFDPILSSVTVTASPGAKTKVELPSTGALSSILAPVQINGNGSDTELTFAGSGVPSTTDTLTGPDSGNLQLENVAVSYSGVGTVDLSPSAGTDGPLVLKGDGVGNETDTVTGAGAGSIQLDSGQPDSGTINYSGVTELDDLVQAQSATYAFTGSGLFFGAPVNIVDGPVVSGSKTTSLQQTFTYPGGTFSHPNLLQVTDPVNFANKTGVTVQGGAKDGTFTVNNPNPADGLGSLEIDSGKGHTNVNVETTSAAVATAVVNSGSSSADVATVTLHAQGQGVQALHGPVDVGNLNNSPVPITHLIIDDTGDTSPQQSIYLDDASLSGLAPAQITWSVISSLTVTGGSGGNSYVVRSQGNAPLTTLHAGDGNNTIGVDIGPLSNFSLTVNGNPGNDELDIHVESPSDHIFSSLNPKDPYSGQVNTLKSLIDYIDIKKLSLSQASPDSHGLGKNDHPVNLKNLTQQQDLGDPVPPAQQPKSPHKKKGQGGHSHRPHHLGRHPAAAKGA